MSKYMSDIKYIELKRKKHAIAIFKLKEFARTTCHFGGLR